MAAIEVDDERGTRATRSGLRAAYDPVYGPLVVLGALLQLAAVGLQDVGLAMAGLVVGWLADLATADERNEVRGRLRRFGLGLLQRVTFRSVLLLAVLLPAGVADEVTVAVVVGLLALGVASRGVGWALLKVVQERPATAERNLGADLPLHGFFERLRERRVLAIGVLAAAELPLGVALLLGHRGRPGAAVVLAATTAVVLLGVTAATGLWARRFLTSGTVERQVRSLEAAIVDTGAQIVLYFSGDRDSTYQLNQWLPVIDRLQRPVLVLLREQFHLDQLWPTRHPVIVCRRHRDVEVALACDPMLVLYVATAGRNIHFLRYGRPTHVFLNHGDSDKVSSANPVVKVYDRLFVAGPLAIDRYRDAGIDLADDRFRVIGRPQLDGVLDGRRRIGQGPPTLLYAPTWEGLFEAADYSSLERCGVALIRRLLDAHPEVRIVYKPHPASGTVRPAAATAGRRVEAMLRAAGGQHVIAADRPEHDLLAWFDRADVLLSDISAVVTDFLATDKPYLVTNPRGLSSEEFRGRFPSHRAAYVVDEDLGNLDAQVDAAFGDDPLAADRAAMKRRVLGDLPDGAFAAFSGAIEDTLADARRHAARISNTFSYDR